MPILQYVFSTALFRAAVVTITLTVLSMAIGIVGGILLAMCRSSRFKTLKAVSAFYVWLFRGTPVLLQLIFVFNVLPLVGLRFDSFTCAVIALSMNEAAYMAEIVRGGLLGIDSGQHTAAYMLGLKQRQTLTRVIAPQLFRLILPPTGNQLIGMLKTSALASIVAVQDLMQVAQRIAAGNFDYVNALGAAALYYLALTTLCTGATSRLEKRLDVSQHEGSKQARPVPVGGIPEARAELGALEETAASSRELSAHPAVSVEGVTKRFGSNAVLKDVSIEVTPGECLVLLGPSGAGKSTLLRAVAGLEPIDAGTILFKNREHVTIEGVARHLTGDIGMVFQQFNLFPHLTAKENVALAPRVVKGLPKPEAERRAWDELELVGMAEYADFYPQQLSGGQQQRVAIARALATRPSLMLFDEPTSALDPEHTREVLRVMREVIDGGMTAIIVTHEMSFAQRTADSIAFMDDGEIVEHVSARDFFEHPHTERARSFLATEEF
jgi:polar amino acid transport system permease protein|nr:amino acid ABC transporter permease/ATP-binding protein [Actinomyces sp.]